MKLPQIFKKRQSQPFNKIDALAVGACALLFSVLALGNMTRWSVWFDEAYGLFIIRSDYLEVARLTALDVHPPMYYWVLKAWTSIFGLSEIAIRSLSTVFFLVAIGFMYILVRRLFGQKAAIYSAVLLSVTPLLLRYAVEARMYGMTSAIVVSSTYLLVSAMEQPKRWKWVVYGLLVALGLWTHYFTALAFAAQWLWRYIVVKKATFKKTIPIFFSKDWLLAHLVAVVAYLPWLFVAIKQLVGIQGGGFWISPITPASPITFVSEALFYRTNSETSGWFAVLMWAIVITLAILIAKVWRSLTQDKQKSFLLLAIMAALPLLLLMIVSLPPLRPALVNRYIVPSAVFLVALIGVVLAYSNSRQLRAVKNGLIACVAIAMITGVAYVYLIGNYNKDAQDRLMIKPTLQVVWQNLDINQPVLVATPTRYYEIAYYEDRFPVGSGVFFEASDNLTWGSYDPLRPKNTPGKIYDSIEFARQHGGKIWYIADWKTVGKPALPSEGSWRVIHEVSAPEVQDGRSSIRAVELQLID